jgi:hypothetical protein
MDSFAEPKLSGNGNPGHCTEGAHFLSAAIMEERCHGCDRPNARQAEKFIQTSHLHVGGLQTF